MAEETSNAKTNAEKNVLSSASSKEKLEELIINMTDRIEFTKNLEGDLLKLKNAAEDILGLASQGALAKAFENRKAALETEQKKWVQYFGSGLLGLFTLTFLSVALAEHLHIPPVVNSSGGFDYWGVLLRILLGGPILWFTWFSVRQYGNNVTLIEDYAFKEASALAFVGYKKDMQDDTDMVKLLRESAIHNFASAPSRLISKSDATSPMHEVFEKAFKDKDFFERFMEIIKALKPEIHK